MDKINGVAIVDPTKNLLFPSKKSCFITMHYIFKTVKRAKFIFIVSHNDTEAHPLKNIK
jgi:hypothetical protein